MLQKIIRSFTEPKLTKALLSLRYRGYLYDLGWFNAFKTKQSVGKNMEPIPWLTYPAIKFLETRLRKDMKIFEFGSGNSTLFYALKVSKVFAVEHDKAWFNRIFSTLPKNVSLMYRELVTNGEYSKSAMVQSQKFDVVIVDGRDRVNCVKNSTGSLTADGILILDNSDRAEYYEAFTFLAQSNFRHIDFWGIAPGFLHTTCTTVFYRPENCFNI